MSFLNEVINEVVDGVFREELQERVEIILHKIKFMDAVPVICLDTDNKPSKRLKHLLETAGGVVQEDPADAKVLIYEEQGRGMLEMMGIVPALLEKEWPAVTYNRVYLFDDHNLAEGNPEMMVSALEDLAEMLYPGYFVFGNEGKTWTAFGV
jgi:iron complex transport system substrate-binding protein